MKSQSSILNSIQNAYRGRIPSRADGKKRRQLILNAVREIIIEQGAQGVKHRAIAERANVPLAATTYYFPDIQALLHDAFLEFSEHNLKQLQQLESKSSELLVSLPDVSKLTPEDFHNVSHAVAHMIFEHIEGQVANREDRIVERAFKNEAIRNPQMGELINQMELLQAKAISQFLGMLGSDDPDSDSREVMAIILFLEHCLLASSIDANQAKTTLERLFRRIIGK